MIPIVFGPNLGSLDMLRLFTHPDEWAEPRQQIFAFRFASEHIMAGTEPGTLDSAKWLEAAGVGPNTYAALAGVNAFRMVRMWNLKTVLGVGAVKSGTCDARLAAELALRLIAKIAEAGGHVDYAQIDSSFSDTKAENSSCYGQDKSVTADAVAKFCATIKKEHPRIAFGLTEGHPTWTLQEIGEFWKLLADRGQAPAYMTIDVDRNGMVARANWFQRWLDSLFNREPTGYRRFREQWNVVARTLPVPIVPVLWAQAPTAYEYRQKLFDWARFVGSLDPLPKAALVETWARVHDVEDEATRDWRRIIPHNLPSTDIHSHTGIVRDVAILFR